LSHASAVNRVPCRICDAPELDLILDLGEQPLANSFLTSGSGALHEPMFPLELCRCGSCGHIQLSVTVPPEVMFRDYIYVSGTSTTIPAHFAAYAARVAERFLPSDAPLVVEVGSNDGTLLKAFRKSVRALGVEPARNIAALARAQGVETIAEFFNEELADRIVASHGKAQAMIANNVIAHINDLKGFARAVASLLAADGVLIAEVPYLPDLVDQLAYDTIYHEHLSYFSVHAMKRPFADAGLTLFDVERVPVHGGSIRVFVGRGRATTANVERLEAMEAARGLHEMAAYREFASRVARQRERLLNLLRGLKADGRRIAGYGAPAKGNTMLNYCGIDDRLVEYIVDKSPLKQGHLTPGTHLPVLDVGTLSSDRPDYALLLAWNFASEIVAQQGEFLDGGGKFILPIPEPKVLT